MRKLFILVALCASLLTFSCKSDKENKTPDIVVDNSGFDDDGDVYLANFSATKLPKYDTWVINDSQATTADFAGLSAALTTVSNGKEKREITLVFPFLMAVPDHAIFGKKQGELIHDDKNDTYYYDYDKWIDFSKYNASAVVAIEAPKAQSVGSHAFAFCYNLTSIDFAAAATIADGAFIYSSLEEVNSAQFPELLEITGNSFFNSNKLTSVDLPLLMNLGDGAFSFCSALETVSAPAVETVGQWALNGCKSLTSIAVEAAQTIGYGAFYGCSALSTINLPDAEEIGKWAFNACTALEEITLPFALTVGDQAFYACSSLNSFEANNATWIGAGAFYNCTALEYVDAIAATNIGSEAFRNCTALDYISLPELLILEGSTFYGCTKLEDVYIPSVEQINDFVFYNCSSLSVLSMSARGAALNSIHVNAFLNCDSSAVALQIGSANSALVNGSTLSVGDVDVTFASINVSDRG